MVGAYYTNHKLSDTAANSDKINILDIIYRFTTKKKTPPETENEWYINQIVWQPFMQRKTNEIKIKNQSKTMCNKTYTLYMKYYDVECLPFLSFFSFCFKKCAVLMYDILIYTYLIYVRYKKKL